MSKLLKAKAKINLFFHITGKLENGYHLLDSMVVFADDVFDIIEIKEGKDNVTSVNGGEFAHLLQDERHRLLSKLPSVSKIEGDSEHRSAMYKEVHEELSAESAYKLATEVEFPKKSNLIDQALLLCTDKIKYHCNLIKNIPIAAGLGGGSSDAAQVIKFAMQNNNLELDDLTVKLTKIGADLPVCFVSSPTYVSGIGDRLQSIENIPDLHLVLVYPNKALLTKDVFSSYNIVENRSFIDDKPVQFRNDFNKLIQFLSPLDNDLTETAIKLLPDIRTILEILSIQPGCVFARMSGSGPTCFGMFTDKLAAQQASKNISKSYPNWWIRYTKSSAI